jgi:hypothetical protein
MLDHVPTHNQNVVQDVANSHLAYKTSLYSKTDEKCERRLEKECYRGKKIVE